MNTRMVMVAIFFISFSFAQSFCEINVVEEIEDSTGGLLPIVFTLQILMIALSFMFANVTNNPEAHLFYKDETFHLLFSLMLLALVGFLLSTSCSTVNYFFQQTYSAFNSSSACYGAHGGDLYDLSTCYLDNIKDDAENTADEYIQQYVTKLMKSTFAYSIYYPIAGGGTVVKEAWKRTEATQMQLIVMTYVFPALASINMQIIALNFLQQFVFSIFIPAGFLFRAFSITRQAGNFLLAFGFGLYLIFPFVYSINGGMDELVFGDCSDYEDIIEDTVAGDCSSTTSFWNVMRFIPHAYFLPTFAFIMFITFLYSMNKALRVIG